MGDGPELTPPVTPFTKLPKISRGRTDVRAGEYFYPPSLSPCNHELVIPEPDSSAASGGGGGGATSIINTGSTGSL